jgi:hypothetical protein
MGAPSSSTVSYPATTLVQLTTITVPVQDINGNIAIYNATGPIIASVTSDTSLSGTTTATLSSQGYFVFSNVNMVQPTGGVHTLTFTTTVDSAVSLASASLNITISPGSPYALQVAQAATNNSLQCQYHFNFCASAPLFFISVIDSQRPVTNFPALIVTLYDSGNTYVNSI